MQNAPYPTLHESFFREASRGLERKFSHWRHPSFHLLLTLGEFCRSVTRRRTRDRLGQVLYGKLHSQNRIKNRMCWRASNYTNCARFAFVRTPSTFKTRHSFKHSKSSFPLSIRVQTKANHSRFDLTELRSSLGVFSFQIALRSSGSLSRWPSLSHQRKIDAARGGSVRWGWMSDILYTTMPRETSEHNCCSIGHYPGLSYWTDSPFDPPVSLLHYLQEREKLNHYVGSR